MRQTATDTAHFLREFVVTSGVHALVGRIISSAVYAFAVHIVQYIAAAPAAAGVAVIGQVHVVERPGEAFGGAGAVVALPPADDTTLPERQRVEYLVQLILLPVLYEIFCAFAGVVHGPAESGKFQSRSRGYIAGYSGRKRQS